MGVDELELFEGCAVQGVDPKGRVAVPADFRSAIERIAADRIIVVSRHPDLPCLRGYDTNWSKTRFARLDGREAAAEDGRPMAREKERAFGPVDRATFDASGRFVLSGYFKAKAQIRDWAFFVGAGRSFNIWAPELLATCPDVDDDTRDMCAWLMSERKARA